MKSKGIFISTNLFIWFLELHVSTSHQSIYPKLVFSFSHMTLSLFTKPSTEFLTKPWQSLRDIGQGHRWLTSMSPTFSVNISKNQASNRPLGTSRTQQSIITRFLEFRIEWRNWHVEYAETFRLNPKSRAARKRAGTRDRRLNLRNSNVHGKLDNAGRR